MQEFLWWFRLFWRCSPPGLSTYCAVMLFHAWFCGKTEKKATSPWAGGEQMKHLKHKRAVLAVLAFSRWL